MRQIVTFRDIAAPSVKAMGLGGAPQQPDDYFSRLIKYIPSEVVALYIALYGMASAAKADIPFEAISWLIFAVGIVGTALYIWRVAKVRDKAQVAISTGSFMVWVFALGGPFAGMPWYHPVYGSMLLLVYTFFIPMFAGK